MLVLVYDIGFCTIFCTVCFVHALLLWLAIFPHSVILNIYLLKHNKSPRDILLMVTASSRSCAEMSSTWQESAVCCSISSGSPTASLYITSDRVRHWVMRMVLVLLLCMHTRRVTWRTAVCACIHCVYAVCVYPYCSGVELHFEFFQIEPVFGLAGVQVMVEVTCCVAETVELPVWSQQDRSWSLLIGHTRVPAFPTPGRELVINTCIHLYFCICINIEFVCTLKIHLKDFSLIAHAVMHPLQARVNA